LLINKSFRGSAQTLKSKQDPFAFLFPKPIIIGVTI
jgi:hypothetical protein